MYAREYKDLWLITLDAEGHEKTCNYWYLVQTYGCTAHTAFAKRGSLLRWMNERGIELTAPLPEHGTHSVQRLVGRYKTTAHMDPKQFQGLQGTRTPVLDNGGYTLGVIKEETDGTRNINYLNCNCERPKLPYAETREQVG